MDNLTKHWSNLSLNDKEGGKMSVKKVRSSNEYNIAAKFLTKQALNIDVIGLLVLSGVPEMTSRLEIATPVRDLAFDKVSMWVQVHNILGGCLDHIDRDCDLWIESDGTLDSSDQEYGAWICAPLIMMTKKSVVVVLGFYESRKKGGSKSKIPVF
uniref:Uncharacterized protein n=1 Tax=Quercus lobata TaxID=97700 RepID=A0A7N2RDF2_QUELO